jgi:membrane-bound acyltransferase YfiQ involved in biofilm formation
MFWWAHRYRDVPSPTFDQVGSLPYYGLVAMQQLALFSVPAFLFISGFFVAYAARGSQGTLSWKIVQTRVLALLWPYLLWSGVVFLTDALMGEIRAPVGYVTGILLGNAVGAYFFIPLIIQFYLMSPLLAPLAKRKGPGLLIGSALVQLLFIALVYQRYFGGRLPSFPDNWPWAFMWWAFYFPLGIVCGFHSKAITDQLRRFRWLLLVVTIGLAVLSVVEAEWLYVATGEFGWPHATFKISSCLYAVAFILAFLAFDTGALPAGRALDQIGGMSYGIYLLHPKTMELAARATYHVAPWLLSQQLLLQPLLIVLSAGLPIVLMRLTARSPMRRSYRYLFG